MGHPFFDHIGGFVRYDPPNGERSIDCVLVHGAYEIHKGEMVLSVFCSELRRTFTLRAEWCTLIPPCEVRGNFKDYTAQHIDGGECIILQQEDGEDGMIHFDLYSVETGVLYHHVALDEVTLYEPVST